MLASEVWIEKLASHEDVIRSVGPLSSEDVAVVVDSHWFTDCHLEAIFNMNKSRLQLRSPTTVDGKDVRLITGVYSEPGSTRYFSAPSITTVWSNYQTWYNDFFEVDITVTVTLSPNIQMVLLTSSVQSIYLSTMSRDQSFFVLICQNCLQLISYMIIHKYVNIQTSVVGPQ